jgi:hypothetical protein
MTGMRLPDGARRSMTQRGPPRNELLIPHQKWLLRRDLREDNPVIHGCKDDEIV